MGARRFDLVVFGATGFTGQYVFEELVPVARKENIKFALAARNKKKLHSVIEESKKYLLQSTGQEINDVAIIIAEINNENSLLEMCKQTKVILNCVAPFYLFGESVIKACIAAKTHYVDVAEESVFLEEMQLKYHHEAMQSGIYIVGACGFGSIFCDMGVSFIKSKFPGDVNSVETYREFTFGKQRRLIKPETTKGFIDCFKHVLRTGNKLTDIRKQLNETIYKKPLTFSHPLPKRSFVFKSETIGKWCIPFIGSDETVTYRSQLFNYNYKNEKPVQIKAYYILSIVNILFSALLYLLNMIFYNFKFWKYLIEFRKEMAYVMVFCAEGWNDKLDTEQQRNEPPNKYMKVVLRGTDPYQATSFCLINAGISCLKESENMPGRGGILTPGAAFGETSLIQRLQKSGMEFIVSQM